MYTEIAVAIFMSGFAYLDGPRIVYNEVTSKYKKWKKLNALVAISNKNKLKIILISLKMILQVLYLSFLQYMNSSIRKINRNTYEISYVVSGKMYKMLVTPKRGPAPVLQVSDSGDNDVTSEILQYMGPSYNWHGNTVTPKFLGYNTLTFQLSNGEEITFEEDKILDKV